MALATIMTATGCEDVFAERQIEVEKILKEKYEEEFQVTNSTDKYIYDNSINIMVAHPIEREEFNFKVEFYVNSKEIIDEYITKKIGNQMESKIKEILDKDMKNYEVIAMTSNATCDCNNKNISIEDFMVKYPKERYAVYLVVDINELISNEIESHYKALSTMFSQMPTVNGGLRVYYVEDENIVDVKEYKKNMTRIDAEFERYVKDGVCIEMLINQGTLSMEAEQFEQLLINTLEV